jgi:hypothetical protein
MKMAKFFPKSGFSLENAGKMASSERRAASGKMTANGEWWKPANGE